MNAPSQRAASVETTRHLADSLPSFDSGAMDSAPYLSVVVTTRNDQHGGNPLKRLQLFVDCLDEQCRRTRLDAEVVVVEWNPPPDRPRIASLLRIPVPASCTYRFIEVGPEFHQRLDCADVLPLFQMIAKNVGIRRARGRFVLVTNIDIIFSTELIELIALRRLDPKCLYRVDRHDIESDVARGRAVTRWIRPAGRCASPTTSSTVAQSGWDKDGTSAKMRAMEARFGGPARKPS